MSDETPEVPELDRFAWEHALTHELSFISDEEQELLIAMLCASNHAVGGREEAEATQEEAATLLAWVSTQRAVAAMIDSVLAGETYVTIRDGEPHFQLTPKGKAKAEKAIRRMGLPMPKRKGKKP